MNENSVNGQAMDEARGWFARLSGGEAAPAERAEFHRWRARPGHAEAYAATDMLWSSLDALKDHPDMMLLAQQVMTRTEPRKARGRFGPGTWAMAASLVCAVGVAAFLMFNGGGIERYSTARGERSTMTLSDGSKVFLNSATALDVRMDGKTRHVRLREGEAQFVVTRDANRPFTVEAGDGEVIVLGTRFQVRSEVRDVTVTLLEGAVALDREALAQPIRMAPGDQVQFKTGEVQVSRLTVDPEVAGSWASGWLRFRSTPLADVLTEVNRYSGSPIRLGDAVDAKSPVSGTFELGDSASVLAALEVLLPVKAVRRRNGEIILQSR